MSHVISASWMNNSGYGEEYPGITDGLGTHSVMSSYMISLMWMCVGTDGFVKQNGYCQPSYD